MNTPLSQHPDPPASTADATVSGGLNRLTIVHLLVVGIAIGAVIAAFASVERRDAISLSQTAEADAWTGMRIVEQGASAAEDYEALARQHFDAAVARARPGQRMAERIGVWLAERGQFGLATPYLLQGLRQSPGYDLALTAASAASAVGDSAATTEAYTMAIQLRPDSPLAYNNLAYHYAVRGVRLPEAERLAQQIPGGYFVNQFANDANSEAHFKTTGPEIFEQMDGDIDAFVAGIGSGGTITGNARYFKSQGSKAQIILADPVGSALAGLINEGVAGPDGSYTVEGIGQNFMPETTDPELIDVAYSIPDAEAIATVRGAPPSKIGSVSERCSGTSNPAAKASGALIRRPRPRS